MRILMDTYWILRVRHLMNKSLFQDNQLIPLKYCKQPTLHLQLCVLAYQRSITMKKNQHNTKSNLKLESIVLDEWGCGKGRGRGRGAIMITCIETEIYTMTDYVPTNLYTMTDYVPTNLYTIYQIFFWQFNC